MALGDLARREKMRRYGGAGDIEMTPELEASLMSRIGDRAIGGIAAAGNILDLPGSTVRDLMTWAPGGIEARNPFDQWLPWNWTSPQNRTTGRELLQSSGLISRRKHNLGGTIAGIGAEIVTDPLFYLTAGGAALTKAGAVVRNAGLMDDVTRVAAKTIGVAPGVVGKRQARVGTLFSDMYKSASKPQKEAMELAASKLGVNTADLMDQNLGGLLGIGLPFRSPSVVLGQGAEGLASKMDNLISKVQYGRIPGTDIQPVNDFLVRPFNATVGEARSKVGQAANKILFQNRGDKQWAARTRVGEFITKLEDFNLTEEQYGDVLRQAFEIPGASKKLPAQLGQMVDQFKFDLKRMPQEAAEYGVSLKNYLDPEADYFPRYLTQTLHGKNSRGVPRVMSTLDPSQSERLEFLHGIKGGTTTSKNVYRDPGLNDLVDNGIDTPLVAEELKRLYGGNASEFYVSPKIVPELKRLVRSLVPEKKVRQGLLSLIDGRTAEQALDAVRRTLPAAKQQLDTLATKHTKDRFREMAKWYSGLSKETRDTAVFGNHPLADLQARLLTYSDSIEAAKTFTDTLAARGVTVESADAGVGPTIRELLGQANLKVGTTERGALRKIAEKMGWDVSNMKPDELRSKLMEIGNLRVRSDIAEDMIRMQKGFSQPDSVNPIIETVQNITNFYKSNLTSPFPAFHVRNLFSGQFQNWVRGMWDKRSVYDAHSYMRGGVIQGAKDIPILQKMWKQRQTPRQIPPSQATAPPFFNPQLPAPRPAQSAELTDEMATRLLSELVYGYSLAGKFQGEAANVVGKAAIPTPGQLDDMLAAAPSPLRDGFSFTDMGRAYVGAKSGTTWNPLHARGVGSQVESRFAPLAGGEQAGYYIEGMNRVAPFINMLRKGVDPAEAARRIGDAQVNYSNRFYTKFERDRVSLLLPFYKFSRGMLPHTIRTLVEEPGGRLAQTVRAVNSARETDALTPDYISETASIPLNGMPFLGNAPEGTQRYMTGLGLMFEDPMSFLGGGARGVGLELLSRSNPLIKGPLEWATGESFFQKGPRGGRDLEDLDPTLGRLFSNVGQLAANPDAIISGKTLDRKDAVTWWGSDAIEHMLGNSPISRILTTARVATDPRKGLSTKALNLLTGVRISDVSPEASEAIVRERTMDLMEDLGSKEFVRPYFPQSMMDGLTPEQQMERMQLQALINELAARTKARAEAAANRR